MSATITTPRERPILFSAPMVRAVLDGSKTQTRRTLSITSNDTLHFVDGAPWRSNLLGMKRIECPYGLVGDRLYVREAWRTGTWYDCKPGSDLPDDAPIFYESDTLPAPGSLHKGRYRHARFMPRRFARITLEITDVRVQRLQDISEEDARAEGVTLGFDGIADEQRLPHPPHITKGTHPYTFNFAFLWDEINGKRPGCSWGDVPGGDNPWVWAISFKRLAP